MSDSDSKSVCSTASKQSISKQKRDCPICKKEIAVESLYRHIKTKHDSHWFESMYANEKMLNKCINECEPVPFMYDEKNDFDEVESKDIYGCLACHNSFTHKGHGTTHCNKAKCKAGHIKECRELLQRVVDLKAKMLNKTDYSKWSREKIIGCIDRQIEWYTSMKKGYLWRILFDHYNAERNSAIAGGREKAEYDFEWISRTRVNMMPLIRDIPTYDTLYNKESKDILVYMFHWYAINMNIHEQYYHMRWNYESRCEADMFYSVSDKYPTGKYIHFNDWEST